MRQVPTVFKPGKLDHCSNFLHTVKEGHAKLSKQGLFLQKGQDSERTVTVSMKSSDF
jgi:hypothetical protein